MVQGIILQNLIEKAVYPAITLLVVKAAEELVNFKLTKKNGPRKIK